MKNYNHFIFSVILASLTLLNTSCNENETSPQLCNNGILEGNEECDTKDFGDKTCNTINPDFNAGSLKCTNTCTIDTSECKKETPKPTCNNGILEENEECDNQNFGDKTCNTINPDFNAGSLKCTDKCTIDTSECKKEAPKPTCNNGKLEKDEECDTQDFGDKTCASINAKWKFGTLACTQDCKINTGWCSEYDLGLQAPIPDVESNDAICSNGLNDFKTVDKKGNISNWFDCKNHYCTQLPLVQICNALENSDLTCADKIDNPMKPHGKNINGNNLIDCKDPSCFKNPRVTICQSINPVKWELGTDCKDGKDNDNDGLIDCNDPDCLHAGNPCELNGKKRILFDNAHHQVAGNADWIVDVTGRHPFPSIPQKEDDWHGALSTWGKELMDTNKYIIETLPQNRTFTFNTDNIQDLKHYDLLISTDPSVKYSDEEIKALDQYLKNGGSILIFSDHAGSDRDGNNWDSVQVFNDMFKKLSPDKTNPENNPYGFTVVSNTEMNNFNATPSEINKNHPTLMGPYGTIKTVGAYAGTVFKIHDDKIAKPLLVYNDQPYILAVELPSKAKIIAIGDSSMAADSTNSLGITHSTHNAINDPDVQNKVFLLNAVEWLTTKK